MKVLLVCSSGGHLTHLWKLKPFWEKHDRYWVTFAKQDAKSLLKNERWEGCYFPTNKSIKALLINTKIMWNVLKKEKTDLIISSGAAIAVPAFFLGKLFFHTKNIYVEVYDRIDYGTMSGKLVKPVTDKYVVQWEEMKNVYPNSVNLGSIF